MADYTNDPVMQRLRAARTDIGNQVTAAGNEINRREGAANQSVAGYLPTLSNIYSGLGDAANSPSLQILRASQQATAPLLQAGFTDLFQRQRGGLDQARLLEQSNLDNQQAQFLSDRAAEDRKQQAAAAEAEKDREIQRQQLQQHAPGADYLAQQEYDRAHGIGNFAPKPLTKTQQSAQDIYRGFAPTDSSADRGAFMQYLDDPNNPNDEYSQLINSPAWRGAQAAAEKARAIYKNPADAIKYVQKLVEQQAKAGHADVAGLLAHLYGDNSNATKFGTFLEGLYAGGA